MLLKKFEKLTSDYILENYSSSKGSLVGNLDSVNYLCDVSKKILGDKNFWKYPDLMTFGYFCRKSFIERALHERESKFKRYGWGLTIHIAPSNVPLNFAFSFVFGLLSGNNNLIRLPSSSWVQVDLLINIFDMVAKSGKYDDIANKNHFIRTEHDNPELLKLVSNCDALVVWGGDETVARFRKIIKKPRCVELYFPDRKSSVIINAREIEKFRKNEIQNLAINFYNDTYLVDNNACSSPRSVLWVGDVDQITLAKSKFWTAVKNTIKKKRYNLNVIAKIDRYLDVMESVHIKKSALLVNKISEDIWLTSKK